jgi:hypothetical protein
MSDATFGLEQLTEWYLLTDDAALANLPVPLSCLNPGLFDCPQSQISKWISRVNDLLHAKQSKFRWTGLCLALATAINSRDLMLEQASKWIQISLSLLSVCLALTRLRLADLRNSETKLPQPRQPQYGFSVTFISRQKISPSSSVMSSRQLFSSSAINCSLSFKSKTHQFREYAISLYAG